MECGAFLVTVTLAHQEPDDLGILHKRCTIGIICFKQALPWAFCEKCQFKSDCPHYAIDRTLLGVGYRDYSGPCFQLYIMIAPLVVVQAVKIELHGTVSGHGHGAAEHDLAHVHDNLGFAVD